MIFPKFCFTIFSFRFLTFHDHPHMTVLSKVIHGELERYAVEPVKEEPKKIVKKKTSNNKNNHLPEKKPY